MGAKIRRSAERAKFISLKPLHFTLFFIRYIFNCTLWNVYFTSCNVHPTTCNLHFTLWNEYLLCQKQKKGTGTLCARLYLKKFHMISRLLNPAGVASLGYSLSEVTLGSIGEINNYSNGVLYGLVIVTSSLFST